MQAAPEKEAVQQANLFFALARALEEPRKWGEDLPSVIRDGLATGLPPLPVLGERLAVEASRALVERERMSIEHARLFLGPFEIVVPPWASLYLEKDRKLMGEVSQQAANAYSEAGLAPAADLREAPDHVTHELEFMYFLAFQESKESEDVWRVRRAQFWAEHLGLWLPQLGAKLAESSTHPYYESLAAAIVVICKRFDVVFADGVE
jgi:putative dimethyl sulfoxide reductase chaperone